MHSVWSCVQCVAIDCTDASLRPLQPQRKSVCMCGRCVASPDSAVAVTPRTPRSSSRPSLGHRLAMVCIDWSVMVAPLRFSHASFEQAVATAATAASATLTATRAMRFMHATVRVPSATVVAARKALLRCR